MTQEVAQSTKEQQIDQAWEQYKQEQSTPTPSKDDLFEMREKGKI